MPQLTLKHTHPWTLSIEQARAIQTDLARHVVVHDDFDGCSKVAGVDVGFEEHGRISRAAAVLLSFPELQILESVVVRRPTEFPYVPGYLSFREIPVALLALERLRELPDLILCDGQGYAHPRRCGLACHLGILTDIPTVGVAKSLFIGTYVEPGPAKGTWTPLVDREECIGAVLRTRDNVKPVYVSIGHRISLPTAVQRVLTCTPRYRLPETTRHADRLASSR